MNNVKRRFMVLCSTIFALMLVLLTVSVSATQGNTWTTRASMTTARCWHQAVAVNGKIYAIGGANNSVEEYNPQANTWTTKASMTDARDYFQAAVVNGKIYAIGGSNASGYLNSVEEYDPATNKWTTKASMATGRNNHQVEVVDGKIYAIGGSNASGYLNSVEEYDPAKNTWTTKASMNISREYFQATEVDGKIYAIGGHNGSGYLNSVEEYDPAKNTWTTKTPMTAERGNFEAAVAYGKIYAIGGYIGSGFLNSVEEYDPTKNTWTTKTPMTVRRGYFEAVVADGKIYAIGGAVSSNYTSSVEEYNLTTNKWTTKASMNDARDCFQAVLVNEKICAIGGYKAVSLNSLEEYTLEYPAPANLTAVSGNAKINLSWTGSQNATSYIIKRSEKSGGSYTTIATVPMATYTDTAVTNGTTYYYIVSAVKNDVESLNSAEVSAKPADIAKAPAKLTAAVSDTRVNLSWTASENAASYNIKRSTTAGGPYTTIATSSSITYTDTTAVNGTRYYYVVTAVNSNGESENSNEVSATLVSSGVTLEVTSIDKSKVGDFITANVVIHNATNICAEDIKVAFDTSKLEFIGAKGAEGIKIYKEGSLTEGVRRYITASLGKTNAANGDKMLLQLTFKAKATGAAKIDITNGRIADNATLEKDIEEKNCGEKIVLIEEKSKDVNRSGEFTLLDLGIDAWYYGDAAANTDTSKYDADVVANGTIDDDDLAEIVKQMLSNSNYPSALK